MLSRRNGYILGALLLIIIGFALLKPPTPHIAIAAEDIIDLGGYTITNTILSAWVVIALITIAVLFLYRRLRNVEEAMVPRGFQNLIEGFLEFFNSIVVLVAGEKNGRRFFPVVASIFLFLLISNWFGLFPWNNIIGVTEDERAVYLENLEDDAEGVVDDLAAGDDLVAVTAVNDAFARFYTAAIPVEAGDQAEADDRIEALLAGEVTASDARVRAEFAQNPIPADTAPAGLPHEIEERLADAGVPEAEFEQAIVFNLPLPLAEVDESEIKATVISSGGVNIVPLRADTFEFDPYDEEIVTGLAADGGFQNARIFDPGDDADEKNGPPTAAELRVPVTVNTAHWAIVLKRQAEGLEPNQGIGLVFPFFRSVATDINLPLAIALWSFIFVQIWGIQTLGFGSNFGKFVGVGKASVVKGPIGIMVGLLEIISEVARIVSFTFRLFGNIFAGEILLFMAAFLVPFMVATVFYGLELFVGFIQAFVFAMLTLVFAVTAVSHGEHEEEEHEGETAAH